MVCFCPLKRRLVGMTLFYGMTPFYGMTHLLFVMSIFSKNFVCQIVNGERASYSAPKFARMQGKEFSTATHKKSANTPLLLDGLFFGEIAQNRQEKIQ
jgi:hypothetical protein